MSPQPDSFLASNEMMKRWVKKGMFLCGFPSMGVSLYRWMVYNGKSQSKMDDLGAPPF
jgi:hypothetical protein